MVIKPWMKLLIILICAISILKTGWTCGTHISDIVPRPAAIPYSDTIEGRLASQQRQISELQARVDTIATALRAERYTNDYSQPQRIESIVARENARDR